VLGLGPPDPAFIARGEQNFSRFAAVLNDSLKGKTWVLGNRLTLADFSIGGLLPSAERLKLPVGRFPEICRWYEGLASLPGMAGRACGKRCRGGVVALQEGGQVTRVRDCKYEEVRRGGADMSRLPRTGGVSAVRGNRPSLVCARGRGFPVHIGQQSL
jgi:hypothetical protein